MLKNLLIAAIILALLLIVDPIQYVQSPVSGAVWSAVDN